MTLYYPDVSNNNWGTEALTATGRQKLYSFLSQLVQQGFAGVCHKMSQGASFVDPYGALCQDWCHQNGLHFIGYHWVTMDDPGAQIQNWLNAGGDVNAMFDFEDVDANDNPTLSIGQHWDVVNAFNARGVNVQLDYFPQWYWGKIGQPDLSTLGPNGILLVSSGYPMGYQADYASTLYSDSGGDTGSGWAPYAGASPSAWQFTSSANISGFSGVDCNAYRGPDLGALFGTGASSPPSVTPPIPPPPASPPTLAGVGDQIFTATAAVAAQFGV